MNLSHHLSLRYCDALTKCVQPDRMSICWMFLLCKYQFCKFELLLQTYDYSNIRYIYLKQQVLEVKLNRRKVNKITYLGDKYEYKSSGCAKQQKSPNDEIFGVRVVPKNVGQRRADDAEYNHIVDTHANILTVVQTRNFNFSEIVEEERVKK